MKSGRRSFLAVMLAWAAAVVALVWPRRAALPPAPEPAVRGPFTRPTQPAEPTALPFKKGACRCPSNTREYRSLVLMLDDMHDYLCQTGHMVLSADNPEMRTIGFSTFGLDPDNEQAVMWRIPLTAIVGREGGLYRNNIPRSFCSPDLEGEERDSAWNLFVENYKSADGRRRLAAAYHTSSQTRFKDGLGPLPR